MTAVAEEDLNLDLSAYAHSPAHLAVARRDHAALHRLVSGLPRLAGAGDFAPEEESLAAEIAVEAVSAAIDPRDVPGRETPLHLAVRLRDAAAAEILAVAGADWSLQNERGWSGLQEAVYARADAAAAAIARHHRPYAWARWRRRLPRPRPRLVHGDHLRLRELRRPLPQPVRPLRHLPHLETRPQPARRHDPRRLRRAHDPAAGSELSLLRRGLALVRTPRYLIVLSQDGKEITGPTEAEVARELATMRRTTMCETGIDITQAKLVPHLNWRRQ